MSEVMPISIRARGSAFATGIGNWLFSTFWAQVAPIGLGHIGWKFYFIFVAFNLVVTLPTVWFTFKETKHLSLEEIDLLFGERALGALPSDINDMKLDERNLSVAQVETQEQENKAAS
jgi:hypothetical protein